MRRQSSFGPFHGVAEIFFATFARGPLRARQCDMRGEGFIRNAQEMPWRGRPPEPTDHQAARPSTQGRPVVRSAAAGVLLLGGLIFFAGVSRPVVSDCADAFDDEAKRIAIAKADADQFTVGFA